MYNKFPSFPAQGSLKAPQDIEEQVVCMDLYPGFDQEALMAQLTGYDTVIDARDIYKDADEIDVMLKHHVTDDRVFGNMYYGKLTDFVDEKRLENAKQRIKGRTLIIGPGAALISKGDVLVYGDMARWEIQLRYRKGMPNFFWDNPEEDSLRKIKRGFFIEWRVFDKYKEELFDSMDWIMDGNKEPFQMAPAKAVFDAFKQLTASPFRTKPYFDPGVWGGQWMKDVCGLDKSAANYAWSFDGVPEENAILLEFDNGTLEIPAMDLILKEPKGLLGKDVYARFGAEFPIRFDFLDTMGGQNLSLQVHPLTEYIHRQFGMAYTQDESYYILDAKEGAHVYLGLKEGVDPEAMMDDLEKANKGEQDFDAEKYVNRIPAKKHDHFLIPAGTIHCSGADSMVLEISATPYCFTFKLWDWGRKGLDGLPRPVHLQHGKKNIQWDRTTDWVMDNLVNAVHTVKEDEHVKEEHTGLHELEFIETRRYWVEDEVQLDTEGTVNMLNLIEGKEAVITSPENKFEPYTVHYAETFILPADAGKYTVSSDKPFALIRAYVRKPR